MRDSVHLDRELCIRRHSRTPQLTSSFLFLASTSPATLSFPFFPPAFLLLLAFLPEVVLFLERPALCRADLSWVSCEPPIAVNDEACQQHLNLMLL